MPERLVGPPVRLEELKHKPGRRRTLRAVGSRRSAIVKLYASEHAATVADAGAERGPSDPVVPRLVRCDAARRLVVLSYLPGTPLREALLAQDGATCAREGFALGSWHAIWRGRAPRALRPPTTARELAILDSSAVALPTRRA